VRFELFCVRLIIENLMEFCAPQERISPVTTGRTSRKTYARHSEPAAGHVLRARLSSSAGEESLFPFVAAKRFLAAI
jgi:hypothetical protein